MIPYYREKEDGITFLIRHSVHVPPHLHRAMELLLVTEGIFELGIYDNMYHMEKGDFAIIFPGLVHYFQNFRSIPGQAIFLWASPALSGRFLQQLEDYTPETPILKAEDLHPDIPYAMQRLAENPMKDPQSMLPEAWLQIILERSIPELTLSESGKNGSGKNKSDKNGRTDLLHQIVSYVSEHFREPLSLESIGHALGVSPYSISRIFSNIYHKNFRQYLGELRLEYAVNLLLYTDQNLTDISLNAGFGSQRSFNRLFREHYHLSPREFRKTAGTR